jgi:hypothetical protein
MRNIASVTVATRRSAMSDAVRSICREGAGKPIIEPPSLNLAEVLFVRLFRGEVTTIAAPGAKLLHELSDLQVRSGLAKDDK